MWRRVLRLAGLAVALAGALFLTAWIHGNASGYVLLDQGNGDILIDPANGDVLIR